MYPDNGNTAPQPTSNPSACGDLCGVLPDCAPLAVPYVPFQQKGSRQYTPSEALGSGTLYPGLNLPFHVKVQPGTDAAAGMLGELQALEFVLVELGLYLDTHRDDSEAFALFQKYAKLEQAARERYEAEHGPIFRSSMAAGKRFDWLTDPWPWELSEGGEG